MLIIAEIYASYSIIFLEKILLIYDTIGTRFLINYFLQESSMCKAAIHSGVITNDGGTIKVEIVEGLNSYIPSVKHGIRGRPAGPASESFVVRSPSEEPLVFSQEFVSSLKISKSFIYSTHFECIQYMIQI